MSSLVNFTLLTCVRLAKARESGMATKMESIFSKSESDDEEERNLWDVHDEDEAIL